MKKIILLIAAILFSILFYEKGLGLNTILFALLIIGLNFSFDSDLVNDRKNLFYAGLFLLSAVFVFVNHSTLSIINFLSCAILFIGCLAAHKSSIYIKLMNGLLTSLFSIFLTLGQSKDSTEKTEIDVAMKEKVWFWFKTIGATFVFSTLFITLYYHSNPKFAGLIDSLNPGALDFGWLVFTALGFLILSNLSSPFALEPLTAQDLDKSDQLEEEDTLLTTVKELEDETKLATFMIAVLNLILGIFIFTDIWYIFSSPVASYSGPNMSQAVHSGIYTIIISIILAISIILYFFRGELNFYEKVKPLKIVTQIWVVLNIILLLLTADKNSLYIQAYGLTYKRIGVFIYLLLTLAGLITTSFKVKNTKNLYFLIRNNIRASFIVLFLCSLFNWNTIITKYNLARHPKSSLNYILQLSDINAPILQDYINKNPATFNTYNMVRIEKRHDAYIKKQEKKSWQDMTWVMM